MDSLDEMPWEKHFSWYVEHGLQSFIGLMFFFVPFKYGPRNGLHFYIFSTWAIHEIAFTWLNPEEIWYGDDWWRRQWIKKEQRKNTLKNKRE